MVHFIHVSSQMVRFKIVNMAHFIHVSLANGTP